MRKEIVLNSFIDCISRYVQIYPSKLAKVLPAARALIPFEANLGVHNSILVITDLNKSTDLEVIGHMRTVMFEKRIINKWSTVYQL